MTTNNYLLVFYGLLFLKVVCVVPDSTTIFISTDNNTIGQDISVTTISSGDISVEYNTTTSENISNNTVSELENSQTDKNSHVSLVDKSTVDAGPNSTVAVVPNYSNPSTVQNKEVTSTSTTNIASTEDLSSNNDVPVEELVPVKAQTFQEAEKEIVDFLNSLLRQILPKIVGGGGASSLSPRCTAAMMKVIGNLRRLKGWTFKMLDSMGKISPGVLKGTSYTMGNYDECLDLSITSKGRETSNATEEMFRGKYCRIKIQFRQVVIDGAKSYHKTLMNETDLGKLKEIIQAFSYIPVQRPYMNHFIGLCFPSTCTDADINQLAKQIPFPGTATLDRCDIKTETALDAKELLVIVLFLFLFLVVFVSTFLDWLLHSKPSETNEKNHDNRCVSVSLSFSICNNTKEFLKNIEEDTDGLLSGKSVRGIVVFSINWFIVGHTYFYPFQAFFLQSSNLENLHKYWNEGCFSVIQAYPLALDALCVCYGFVLTYSIWNVTTACQKTKVHVIGLIIKYYLRLCLPLLFCIGFIFLLPLLGSGPLWEDVMKNSQQQCKESAATYIGMYGNFLNLENQCFPHLWFIPCLGQLTLLGILLCWILSRSLKIGIFFILLLCTSCIAAIGYLTLENDFPPSFMPYFAENASSWFWQINLSLPISHFGPFAIGMLTGILISRKENHRSGRCLSVLGWIVFIGILYAIFSIPFELRSGSYPAFWSAIYAALHRTLFGVCVAWVMIASSFNIGGFLSKISTWRIFDPLYKLSLYAYLFHGIIMAYVIGTTRSHMTYSHLHLITRVPFYVAASYTLSYIAYMLLEMPLRSLRAALCPNRIQQIDVTPLNNFKIPPKDTFSKNFIEGNCKLWAISETRYGDLK